MPNTDAELNENLEQNGYLNSDSLNNNHITDTKNGYCLDDRKEAVKATAKLSEPIRRPVKQFDNQTVESRNRPQTSSPTRESQSSNRHSPPGKHHQSHLADRHASDWSGSEPPSAKVDHPQTNHLSANSPDYHLPTNSNHQHLKPNHQPTKEELNQLKNHFNPLNKPAEEDDDNNSVFLSPEKSRLVSTQSGYLNPSGYLGPGYLAGAGSYLNNNNNLVYKKCKKRSPKNKRQQIISLNNPNVLNQFNQLNANHHQHLNNQLNGGQYSPFILTEHSITVMEESTDDEKQHEQESLYNDLNRITINAHENRYQFLNHQHFHHHPNDKMLNDERQLIAPTIVQPTNTTAALFALQQRKQLQQQQLKQRKEQNAKYIKTRSTVDALNGLMFVLSAIYAKLIVILGLCFPMAEVISHRIPIRWYEGFYLYLYMGSILFLGTLYLFREKPKHEPTALSKVKRFLFWSNVEREKSKPNNSLIHENSFTSNYTLAASGNVSVHSSCSESDSFLDHNGKASSSSFYLRIGAVGFGIGSMIYSGLEFGLVFELENKEQCYSFLLMMLPASHVCFTFFQLYFIFMNSKALIVKHRYFARFGLMHTIATNLSVWLHVVIQETKHQITILMHPNKGHDAGAPLLDNLTATSSILSPLPTFASFLTPLPGNLSADSLLVPNLILSPTGQADSAALIGSHRLMKRSIEDHDLFTTHGICRRSNVLGQLVMDASQFLFPCVCEYSLICAAILYIMWKSTDFSSAHGRPGSSNENRLRHRSAASSSTVNNYQHPKHYYQVDCAKSVKGLFCGIFLLVVCIISLILFFVLIKKPSYRNLGIFQAHVVEIILYVINAIACVIAIIQIKELPYNRERNVELDNILLIVAQFGLYLFNGFSLIGAHFYNDAAKVSNSNTQLVKIGAIVCLIQATLQTVFILDATKRTALNSDQVRRKPGREMVTFLLVCNFSMWAINTLETRRSESTPVQLNFYGPLCWTVFTHITAPLTIFFRFHSTVCLCDIWKKFSKLKSEY